MTVKKIKTSSKERLAFRGCKVYFSGSIRGMQELDPNFAWKLVQFMKRKGAIVLTEHVAGRNKAEIQKILARELGLSIRKLKAVSQPWFLVRRHDLSRLHEATHLVALVNAPSHGVGMELQEAIRKPQLGMNSMPILCLVYEEVLPKLSFMIRGISKEESINFFLLVYKSLKEAKKIIFKFLTNKL